jgi:hypothetical protein
MPLLLLVRFLPRKFSVNKVQTKVISTLYEDLCTFVTTSVANITMITNITVGLLVTRVTLVVKVRSTSLATKVTGVNCLL